MHRCPECGFAYDRETVIARPSKPWKTYFTTLGVEFLFLYLLGPPSLRLLLVLLGPIFAGAVSIVALLLIPAGTVILIHRANRGGRFAAVSRAGLSVRNLRELSTVEWEELSMLSTRDIAPWAKRCGEDQTISLRGIFDSKREMRIFEAAASRARGAYFGKDEQDAPRGQTGTLDFETLLGEGIAGKSAARASISPLTVVGIILLCAAFLLVVIRALFARDQVHLGILYVSLGWIGIALILIAAWRSDRRTKWTE